MFCGWLLVKWKLLKPEDSKVMSVVAIYLVTPCVIVHAFQVDYSADKQNGLLLAIAVAILIHIVFLFLPYMHKSAYPLDKVEKASLIYSNSGNLLIPIVSALFGKEWIFYTSAYISVQLIFLWTHGKVLLSGKRQEDLWKILTNINFLAVVLGLCFFWTGTRLPLLVDKALGSIADMIGPLFMIIAGMLVGSIEFRKVIAYGRIYVLALLRMIIYPSVVLLVLKYYGLNLLVPDGDTILFISFLAAIAPSSSTITQMVQVYGGNAEHANIINLATTIFCILTMPFMALLYRM